jgi:hypothetical protein
MFATALTVIALATGCSGGSREAPGDEYNDDPKVLNIVMGSEQHLVFDQIVRPWCEKNGLTCDAQELGPVDQANKLSEDCHKPSALRHLLVRMDRLRADRERALQQAGGFEADVLVTDRLRRLAARDGRSRFHAGKQHVDPADFGGGRGRQDQGVLLKLNLPTPSDN